MNFWWVNDQIPSPKLSDVEFIQISTVTLKLALLNFICQSEIKYLFNKWFSNPGRGPRSMELGSGKVAGKVLIVDHR